MKGRYRLGDVPYRLPRTMNLVPYQHAAGILDVAALPLDPHLAFNRARSGQKWMEMALHSAEARAPIGPQSLPFPPSKESRRHLPSRVRAFTVCGFRV